MFSFFTQSQKRRMANRPSHQLRLEVLEDRCLMSTDMVANLSGDPSVVNSLPYWVAHSSSNDIIQFEAGLQGTITPTGSNGIALDVNKNLIIEGPGTDTVTISGGGQNQVFNVESGVTANISGLTIARGAGSAGGGIFNGGDLTLTNVRVTGNVLTSDSGSAEGAGIYNSGTLNLSASTVDHNSIEFRALDLTSTGLGGGIYNGSSGILNMTNDTVDDNQISGGKIDDGGAVYNAASTTSAIGHVSMLNVTIANNLVSNDFNLSDGDGIYNAGFLSLLNTIVYDPNGVTGVSEVSGKIDANSNNLIGSNTNPLLGSLQNNGGTTPTMALDSASPAIGSGLTSGGVPTTDQRGFPRPAASIDIGAYQYQPSSTATNLSVSSTSVQSGQSVLLTATVSVVNNRGSVANPITPQGTVTFYIGSTAWETSTLTNGSAILGMIPPVGSNNIHATYNGETVGAFVLDPSASSSIIVAVSSPPVSPPVSLPVSPPVSLPPVPPTPVGPLSLFAWGFGSNFQPEIFEVDQAGEVFALPLADLFSGQGSISFVNSSIVLSEVLLQDQGVLGILLDANGQPLLMEFLSFSDPHVFSAAASAVLSEYYGVQPQPTGGGGSNGGGNPGGTSNGPGFFSGAVTESFSLVAYLSDEDGHVASLSGKGTIIVTGDGNYQDGVNYSISIKLDQDLPLHPTGYLFPQGIDYSGTFTATGHALPQVVDGNQVPGWFGGGANNLFLSGGSTSDHLTLVADPDWYIYVNSSGGGPNGGPSFDLGAGLNQRDTGTGQPFGVTAFSDLECGPTAGG